MTAAAFVRDDSGRAIGQSRRRCECHPFADRHRFGKTLDCNREGCETNFHQHQINPRLCEGGLVPSKIRAHREDA